MRCRFVLLFAEATALFMEVVLLVMAAVLLFMDAVCRSARNGRSADMGMHGRI